MQKTQIYLSKKQLLELKHLAFVQQTSYANLVRIAVDQYLKQARKQDRPVLSWLESAKKYAIPMGGIGQRIDEELYQ